MDDLGCIDCERCWIKGTYRGFVVDSQVYFDDLEDEEETTIGLETEFAWGISAEELLRLLTEKLQRMKKLSLMIMNGIVFVQL